MVSRDALNQALFDAAGQPIVVTRIEFEVFDTGSGRWILWACERRLFTGIISQREDLVSALQASAVLLRTMMIARRLD
jgi:hypothetical protein